MPSRYTENHVFPLKVTGYVIFTLVVLSVTSVMISCDLARDNPLDPKSPFWRPPSPVLQIQSYHKLTWYPGEYYSLKFEFDYTWEGAVDSVVVQYHDSLFFPMMKDEGIWTLELEQSGLLVNNLAEVIGHPFYALVYDRGGVIYKSDKAYVYRVIEYTPEPRTPDNAAEVDPLPEFVFKPIYQTFPFTITLTIRHSSDTGFETLINVIEGIESTATSCTCPEPLQAGMGGTFFWTIAIVDEFGNTSHSLEATFLVPGP